MAKNKLFLVIAGVIVGLIIGEVALRILHIKVENCIPWYYHIRDEFAENDIAPNFPLTTYGMSYSKFLVWSNELGCFDNPYRGEKEYIVLLGDSFAWGCAPFERKYGTLLEKYLNYRVLKCGVPGYGTRQEFLKLRKLIKRLKYKPQLIILSYYCGNDLADDYLFPNRTIVEGYSVSKTALKDIATGQKEINPDEVLRQQVKNYKLFNSKKAPGNFIGKVKRWLLAQSAIYQLMRDNAYFRRVAKKFGLVDTPTPALQLPLSYIPIQRYGWLANAWEDHLDNLKAIRDLAGELGSQLLVVIIPQKEQVYDFLKGKEAMALDWEQPNRMVKELADKEGIMCLDLIPSFKSYGDQTPRENIDSEKDFYWAFDTHFNIKGNELAFLLIARYILENRLVDIQDADKKMVEIEKGIAEFRTPSIR